MDHTARLFTRCATTATMLLLILLSLYLARVHAGTITMVQDFGSNPGGIKMYAYVPEDIHADAPLVVSLHGCRQDANIYSNAGWKDLADEWKFYLVFPEQTLSNNYFRCWNWFESGNIARGEGEIASVIEMIGKMKTDYSVDEQRIFVEGLSAGGWMTTILLAAYPDVFAGGATNSGGPAFCVRTKKYVWDIWGWWYRYEVNLNAEKCMGGIDVTPEVWGDRIRDEGYAGFNGPWPVISIWHGTADTRVDMLNQQEIVDQWTNLHGIDLIHDQQETLGPHADIIHKEYRDNQRTTRVETYLIPGLGHGTPIATDSELACGKVADNILEAGICAVRLIGQFWGLDNSASLN